MNNEVRSDHFNNRDDDRIRDSGGEQRESGEVRDNRDGPREDGGGAHGSDSHGGRR